MREVISVEFVKKNYGTQDTLIFIDSHVMSPIFAKHFGYKT